MMRAVFLFIFCFTFIFPVLRGQYAIPIAGSPYNLGRVNSKIWSGVFFEKSTGNNWNLSFVKPDYIVELKYISVGDNYKYRGKTITGDLLLSYPDGQQFFYSRKGANLFLTSAIVSTSLTKTGLVLIEFENGKPFHFNERINGYRYSAVIKIDKTDLSADFVYLAGNSDMIQLKADYLINRTNFENGTLENSNLKMRVQRYVSSVTVNASSQVINKGVPKDIDVKLTNWPSFLREEVAWGAFEYVNFYTDAYIDPVISYRIKDNKVRDLKGQLSMQETSVYNQDDRAVVAYPNPSPGEVYFDLINYPKGQYKIEFFNLVGFKVKTFFIKENQNSGIKIDLSDLRPSVYTYTVYDASGKRITSKRINLISS